MAVVIPNKAEKDALTILFDPLRDPKLKLWTGATVPGDGNVIGDFTAATFDGYAPIALDALPAADTDGAGNAFIDAGLKTFTSTGGTATPAIKGALVTILSAAGAEVLYCVIGFDLPVTITAAAQQIKFTLKLYATKVAI